MWTCPHCNKTFAKENQWHVCVNLPPEAALEGKAAILTTLFESLLAQVQNFAEFQVSASTKAISLYASNHKTFLVLQPKKKWMDVLFFLDREETEFPVFKVVPRSKTSWAHYVRLHDEEDLDAQLVRWIAEGHQAVLGRTG